MAEGEPTYPVTITFTSPGACPPVYIAGSFTLPEWQPQELEYSVVEQKDAAADNQLSYVFSRTLKLPEGTFQYKFRLGHEGDWWVCDSNVEIGKYSDSSIKSLSDRSHSYRLCRQPEQSFSCRSTIPKYR